MHLVAAAPTSGCTYRVLCTLLGEGGWSDPPPCNLLPEVIGYPLKNGLKTRLAILIWLDVCCLFLLHTPLNLKASFCFQEGKRFQEQDSRWSARVKHVLYFWERNTIYCFEKWFNLLIDQNGVMRALFLEDYPAWHPLTVTESHHGILFMIPNQRVTFSNPLSWGQ